MDAVNRLKEKFLRAGGTQTEFQLLGCGHLELGDTERQDGATRPGEARAMALKCFVEGALIEMTCYDGRGRGQGEAIVIFKHWLDKEQLVFRGEHLAASDEYYEWWSANEADFSRIGFHICEKPRNRCKVDGGPREEVIHLTKWRMASPQTLIGSGYASNRALAYFANVLDHHLATAKPEAPAAPFPPVATAGDAVAPPGPVGRPVAPTTGLDGAALGAGLGGGRGDDEAVDDLLAMARDAKKEPAERRKDPRREKGSDKGLGRLLADRAAQQREEQRDRSRRGGGSRKKRRHEDDDDDARLARQKRLRADESDSEGTSGSEAGFRVASSREVDLVRLSQKNPGCLLRSALKEMSRYLAARGEALVEEPGSGKVVSYLHRILLPQYPKTGIRSHRELVTLATALDLLLDGRLGQLGDLLAQRFKAIEASLAADGNWAVARHQELIPTQASLSTKAELTEAAKAEIRAQKLRSQLSRGGPPGAKSG